MVRPFYPRRPQPDGAARRGFPGTWCFLLIATVLWSCAAPSQRSAERLPPINADGVRTILSEYRGRVVLLNFWATWCAPCVEEFPHLVRLARENSSWLSVISISIDNEEDVAAKVIPFLRRQGAAFVSYIKKTHDDESFINGIDPEWSGAIPATFIFAPDGKLAMRLIGQQSFDKFDQAVRAVASQRHEGSSE